VKKKGVVLHQRPRRRFALLDRIKRLFKREPEGPADPFAYVGAPKKPRPPHRSATAAEPLD